MSETQFPGVIARRTAIRVACAIALVGLALVVTGLVFGATTVRVPIPATCGTAFKETITYYTADPNPEPSLDQAVSKSCANALSDRRRMTWELIGVGTGLLVIDLCWLARLRSRSTDRRPSD